MQPLLALARLIDRISAAIGRGVMWLIFASILISAAVALVRALAKGMAPAFRVNAVVPGPVLPPEGTTLAPKGASGWGVLSLDRLVRDMFEG